MKNFLIVSIFFLSTLMFGQVQTPADEVKVLVELAVPKKGDTVSFVYYGHLKRKVFNEILMGDFEGSMIGLTNVHYVNDDQEFVKYEDQEDTGVVMFLVKHIVILIEKKKFN
ncbi:MAG: hypothetical protein Q4F57_02790 [Weeksellaceae bacterium]|nr:hypothetical protein [Weeksellaceae bacterium]